MLLCSNCLAPEINQSLHTEEKDQISKKLSLKDYNAGESSINYTNAHTNTNTHTHSYTHTLARTHTHTCT